MVRDGDRFTVMYGWWMASGDTLEEAKKNLIKMIEKEINYR